MINKIINKEATLKNINNIESEHVEWFWQDRFQAKALNLLSGNQDVGKSTFSLFLAANTLCGGYWHDAPDEPIRDGSVIYLTTEDKLSLVKLRLEANLQGRKKNNGNEFFILEGYKATYDNGETKDFPIYNLKQDIDMLISAIQTVGNVRLVIIDPIVAYAGNTKENDNLEVRAYLNKFKVIADKMDVTILGLSHLNKDSSKIAAHRTLGSVAWTAVPRSAWLIEQDPDNEDRRLLLKIKCNAAAKPKNVAFKFHGIPITIDGKTKSYPACCLEKGEVTLTADEVLNADLRREKTTKLAEAKQWLTDFLGDGSKITNQIMTAAKKAGIPERTLRRAKDVLGLKYNEIREGGKIKCGLWGLPD